MKPNKFINLSNELASATKELKSKSPLIYNLSNLVVMNTTANILLAVGASPVMAHSPEELDELTSLSSAVVLNMGTLDENWLHACKIVQTNAHKKQLPVIFDPVGAGATLYRTHAAKVILDRGVTILRGNASEILALYSDDFSTKGVDSQYDSNFAIQAALNLSKRYQCCIVVSGETDIICQQQQTIKITHGSSLLASVTGMGCSSTALIAAFAAVTDSSLYASLYAMLLLSLASEEAELLSQGPGTFYSSLLDQLYSYDPLRFVNTEYRLEVNDET